MVSAKIQCTVVSSQSTLSLSFSGEGLLTALSVDGEEFDVEDEVGVGGDDATGTPSTISFVSRNNELGSFAEAELGDTLVPALDNAADADLSLEGTATGLARRVELGPILSQRARVVHRDGVARLREVGAVTSLDTLNLNHFDRCKRECSCSKRFGGKEGSSESAKQRHGG